MYTCKDSRAAVIYINKYVSIINVFIFHCQFAIVELIKFREQVPRSDQKSRK